MQIITSKNIKLANSSCLGSLLVWAGYYENNPRLDYMKLQRVGGEWFIKVVLK